jgi:hypothetical protein
MVVKCKIKTVGGDVAAFAFASTNYVTTLP